MRLANSEAALCEQLARYLSLKHPGVLFHFDFGSGTKLSIKQASAQKRLNRRAWPDLFIAQPKVYGGRLWNGLFIELKRDGTRIKKLNGDWASDHIAEQFETLDKLEHKGYLGAVCVGYDEAVRYVDAYLNAAEVQTGSVA